MYIVYVLLFIYIYVYSIFLSSFKLLLTRNNDLYQRKKKVVERNSDIQNKE